MNDKDKEAFDEWLKTNIKNASVSDIGKVFFVTDFAKVWQAACEYKQKEVDELLKQLKHEHDLYKKHLKVYEDENAKLRECVEFYASGTHWDLDQLTDPSDIEEINVMNRRIEYSSGKRARQVLKELEDK